MGSSSDQVLRRRLATQRLTGRGLSRPEDVVRLLTAVQSQEWAHAFWSVGMRTDGATYTDVLAAFDAGRILRTHMLRTTWHLVDSRDIRWLLDVTSPGVLRAFGSSFRAHGLDASELRRTGDLLVRALAGGNHLTRPELRTELERQGVAAPGQRLAYIVMGAELNGLICSGPMRGAQHTYAVLDERVAPGAGYSGEQALAALAHRFFAGHGPASLKDFTRWSSLTVADARTALAAASDRLAELQVDGEPLWFDPSSPSPRRKKPVAHLLPLYDEALLTYPKLGFPLARDHPHPPGADLFVGSVVVGQCNVGTWRRTLTGKRLTIETDLAPGLGEDDLAAVREAVDRLAVFLGHPPPSRKAGGSGGD